MRSVGARWGARLSSLTLSLDKPLMSVMHGQCDARPTVTFPAVEQRSVAEAHVYEQLALTSERPGVELAAF